MTGCDSAAMLVALVVEDSGACGPLVRIRVVADTGHGRQIRARDAGGARPRRGAGQARAARADSAAPAETGARHHCVATVG